MSKTFLITFAVLLASCTNLPTDDKDYLHLPTEVCTHATSKLKIPGENNNNFTYLLFLEKSCLYTMITEFSINNNKYDKPRPIKTKFITDEYLEGYLCVYSDRMNYYENENGLIKYEYQSLDEQCSKFIMKMKMD